MTTATLDHLNVRLFQTGLGGRGDFQFTKNTDGTANVSGLKVFKSGTFRDSEGIQHTWDPEHLMQMVFNFDLLKGRDILPNVPVRADHSISINNIVGYIDRLYVDGEFLRADFKLTEPDAVAKFERGTYRARSAEVSMYQSNDESYYWPVIVGFAFVDLPAVEGLYAAPEKQFTVITDKETPVPEAHTTTAPPPPAPPAPAGLFSRMTAGDKESPVTFSIGGKTTGDPVAVQNHISVLEKFQADAIEAGRLDYVKRLAEDNKIAATQLDGLSEFAKTLTADQFTAFKSTWDGAQASPVFAKHVDGNANADGTTPPGSGANGSLTELEELEAVVAMHKKAGTPGIEKMSSFVRLQALRAQSK